MRPLFTLDGGERRGELPIGDVELVGHPAQVTERYRRLGHPANRNSALASETVVVDELTRLAVAAGRGDALAREAFVRRSQADVWRFCAGLDHRDRADDLTQETYLRALPALSRFRAEASARSWLLSIARRVVADSIRRTTRDRRLIDRLQPGAEAVQSPTGLVDLRLLVARLPVERREAFVLTQTLGLSYGEAADVVGCPIGTIRSRVARAREQLVTMTSAPERGEAGN